MKNEIGTENLVKGGGLFYPEAINSVAKDVDLLFYFIFALSVIVFVGLVVATVYFLIKPRQKPTKHLTHSNTLEITWTVIPTILVMIIFFWGFKDYLRLQVPHSNALEIKVTGKKWLWEFVYPNGYTSVNELVIPEGRSIKLLMSAADVLHSFYVPNMRVKRDLIPNRYSALTLYSEKRGTYTIFCTEYCGDGHSIMLANLIVKGEDEYQEWIASAGSADDDLPLDELGKKLYTNKGCNACHSLDGSQMVGPTWKGLYKKSRPFTDGSSAIADENYIRESIVYPYKKIVKGYYANMPSYAGLLSDREIDAIIAYIKTLKE